MNPNKFPDTASEPGNLGKLGGALRFEAVEKRYGDFVAVKSLDLSIAPGEFLTLLGPSGSGKSSLLRLINRLQEPSGGAISIDNRPMDQYEATTLRRLEPFLSAPSPTVPQSGVRGVHNRCTVCGGRAANRPQPGVCGAF